MVLLHGLPGNERNLDLAQAVRRAGWTVVTFNYRGSWGSPGHYSFAGDLKDTVGVPNYTDYKLGATYDLSPVAGSGVSIAAAVVGATKKNFYGDIHKTRFIVTLSKSL
jgi:pimeloyl-ACP methyl ester carboxylesterase